MKYNRTITLKDGRTCVLRNGTEQDAKAVLDNFILTHGQTDFSNDLSGGNPFHNRIREDKRERQGRSSYG